MTDELAERLGGVNTIVAIDPAKDGGGTYNPNANFGTANAQIDFAQHSNFSWAFYSRDGGVLGITAGNETTPTSADEAITVTNSEHSKLVNLFSYMLENPTGRVTVVFGALTCGAALARRCSISRMPVRYSSSLR